MPYIDKPPLYLWTVMLCRWITGTHCMWLLTLLSLVPALGIVRVMDVWTRQEMDGENRALAQLMLLTSGLLIGSAVTLRMDMLICLFIILALHAFWQILKGAVHNRRYRWLFPIYLFLTLFTKEPLGLLISLCSTVAFLALSGRIRQFFHY